ncbi:MAG TPA: hypothetical protein VN397_00415 [Candidatus Methylomirabilis sp.]|nr:hypothetical protein [Candidatus Methylomirabilis sp.]
MVSLTVFLIAWIVLLAIFGLLVLLTLVQMLRHGLPSPSTYVTTFLFLLVTAGVVIGTSWYLTGVDWNATINLVPESILPFFLGGQEA